MAAIFDDTRPQWFMALTVRGESFSMPLVIRFLWSGRTVVQKISWGLDDDRFPQLHEPARLRAVWQSSTHEPRNEPKPCRRRNPSRVARASERYPDRN